MNKDLLALKAQIVIRKAAVKNYEASKDCVMYSIGHTNLIASVDRAKRDYDNAKTEEAAKKRQIEKAVLETSLYWIETVDISNEDPHMLAVLEYQKVAKKKIVEPEVEQDSHTCYDIDFIPKDRTIVGLFLTASREFRAKQTG